MEGKSKKKGGREGKGREGNEYYLKQREGNTVPFVNLVI